MLRCSRPQRTEARPTSTSRTSPAGYRASKVIGTSVVNEANEAIGKIDDLLVTRDGKEPYLAFICGTRGSPLTKESFGNAFKEACQAAGISEHGKAAHGLRKVGATRAAENGATVAKLARGAIGKLERTPDEQSIPAPYDEVRAEGRNPK